MTLIWTDHPVPFERIKAKKSSTIDFLSAEIEDYCIAASIYVFSYLFQVGKVQAEYLFSQADILGIFSPSVMNKILYLSCIRRKYPIKTSNSADTNNQSDILYHK